MVGLAGWAARSGGVSGLGVKLQPGGLQPHLSPPWFCGCHKEKGDGPVVLTVYSPGGCQALIGVWVISSSSAEGCAWD